MLTLGELLAGRFEIAAALFDYIEFQCSERSI